MNGEYSATTPPSHARARRFGKVIGSILPAAALLLLPKCPLCLAAWLTLATGVSFSARGTTWLRPSIVVLWIAALALLFRRRCSHVRRA